MTHNAYLRFGLTLFAACWLTACTASFLPKPVPAATQYTLDDAAPASGPVTTVPNPDASTPSLIVNMPNAAPGFDTPRMVYVERAHEIEYFARHQWVDTPAHMLAPLLVHAIERTGAFRAVLKAPTTATARFRLDTEVIRLQQDFVAPPSQVRLTLRAALIDTRTRSIAAQAEFNASVPANSEDPYGGVIAAQRATAQVLADLAAFCAAALR